MVSKSGILREYKEIVAQSKLKDKREYLVIIMDNFCQFCMETYMYVVTPHLNRLDKTVQMRGHNIWSQ